MVPVLQQGVRCRRAPFDRPVDPDGHVGGRARAVAEGGARLRVGIRQGDLAGDGARPAARLGRAGAAARALGGACARPHGVRQRRRGRAAVAARDDVHVLRGAGRRRPAGAPRVAGRRGRVLARQHGAEPGGAGVHGLRARAGTGARCASCSASRWCYGIGYLLNRIARPEDRSIDDAQLAALAAEQAAAGNPFVRWMKLLARMAVRLVPEYIVLVLLLGAARAWLFPHIGPDIGNHLGWIVAFAVAGMLFVIPTAGEVPIIQAMLSLGMGVGPAAALLMTLPPISVPSLAMLARSFKPYMLAIVATLVVVFGIVSGLLAIAFGF
ncbi:hypothetical protein BCPG_00210 [Burkholderia cenocepacia PC184]|nr:hypothetical protein BCPG_00210 [Burkholderia cenocepacia PC184]